MAHLNSSPTFSNPWLHSNQNLGNHGQWGGFNDGLSGSFKVFHWTTLHVTHFSNTSQQFA